MRETADGIRLPLNPKVAIDLAAGDDTEIITAMGLGMSPTHLVPVAILRRNAKSTRYVWAISLAGQVVKFTSNVNDVDVHSDGKLWHLSVDPLAAKCAINTAE